MTATPPDLQRIIADRSDELRRGYEQELWRHTDRLFAALLAVQWIASIGLALWLTPREWNGLQSRTNPLVWAAIILGGIIAILPIGLAIFHPGKTLTRHVIGVAQMLHSALLIHVTNGRIETHFHVFGSLAFLSFYRDWRLLVPATLVVAVDHALRGMFYPESVFGVSTASSWRWIEHAGWVIFEDICLVWACVRGARELRILAARQAELETINQRVEAEVVRQTARLAEVSAELVTTARRAGMAEIATGVLHNVGNVLNSVNVSATLVGDTLRNSEVASLKKVGGMIVAERHRLAEFITADERGRHLPEFIIDLSNCLGIEQNTMLEELSIVQKGLDHIKHVISLQQKHAKTSPVQDRVNPAEIIEAAISLQSASFARHHVAIRRNFTDIGVVAVDKHTVMQILINLIDNAKQSVKERPEGARSIEIVLEPASSSPSSFQIRVVDTGVGISPENLTRIFGHGFTTRDEGHGFGLHSAANAARAMGGSLTATSNGPGLGACFTLELPLNANITDSQLAGL